MYGPFARGNARFGASIRHSRGVIIAFISLSLGSSTVCRGFSRTILLSWSAIKSKFDMDGGKAVQRTTDGPSSVTLRSFFKLNVASEICAAI